MKTITMMLLLLFSGFLQAQEKEDSLKEAVQTIHLIWTEWMGKPKLTYDSIDQKDIGNYHGTWIANFINEGENQEVALTINADGSWSDNLWKPGKMARWYLAEGLIVLFEEPEGQRFDGLASVLLLKNKTLHLMHKGAESGLVPLKKQAEPGAVE